MGFLGNLFKRDDRILRDGLKDKKYFRKYLKDEIRLRKEAEEDIANGEVKKEQILMVQSSILSKSLHILIAKYSAGEPIESLYPDLIFIIEQAQIGWHKEHDYMTFIWLLSISVLIDLDDEHFQILSQLYAESSLDDFLLNYLLGSYKPASKTNQELLFPRPYQTIKEIINNEKEAIPYLKKYLEKQWYKGYRDSYWHDTHKSKFDIYFGYWSWETGAIAKLLRVDDSSLKDTLYYPYDMVHK